MDGEARSLEEQLFCFWQNLVDFTRRDRACALGRRHLQTKASVRNSWMFLLHCLFALHQKGKIDPKMAAEKDVFWVFFRLTVWLKLSHWREDPLGTNFSVDWQAFQGFKRYHQQRHAKVLQDQLARPGLAIPCSSCQTFFCVGRWFPVDFRSHRCQKMAQNTFASMRIRVQMRSGAEES